MNWQDHITSEAGILGGKPIIKGTRLAVEHIVGYLASGWTEKDLFENLPSLTPEGLQACYAFINDCMIDGLLIHDLGRGKE